MLLLIRYSEARIEFDTGLFGFGSFLGGRHGVINFAGNLRILGESFNLLIIHLYQSFFSLFKILIFSFLLLIFLFFKTGRLSKSNIVNFHHVDPICLDR